jgi:hypothetical protein
MTQRGDRIATADIGTTHWIWALPIYQTFASSSSAGLWIHGKPGSGKSVLAKAIIRRLSTPRTRTKKSTAADEPIVCSWFYSHRDGLTGHALMLRALLHSLIAQAGMLFEEIAPWYRLVACSDEPHWSSSEVLDSLKTLVVKCSEAGRQIWFVLDALDEADLEASENEFRLRTVLDFLSQLLEGLSGVKVMLISRPSHSLSEALASWQMISMQDFNTDDVRLLVDRKIKSLVDTIFERNKGVRCSDEENELATDSGAAAKRQTLPTEDLVGVDLPLLSRGDRETVIRMRNYLHDNAKGVFLWASTIVSTLERHAREPFVTLGELENEMYSLPQDELGELYEAIVKKLDKALTAHATRCKAKRALIWTALAAQGGEALNLQRLMEIFTIPTDSSSSRLSPSRPLNMNSAQDILTVSTQLSTL